MNVWLYWRKFIHNSLSVIPLISHLKVFVNLGCFLREWSRLRRLLCVTSSEPNEKFFVSWKLHAFQNYSVSFHFNISCTFKEVKNSLPKASWYIPFKSSTYTFSWPRVIEHAHKVSMGQNTARILDDAYDDETHPSAKVFQTKDEWGRKQFVLVKTN